MYQIARHLDAEMRVVRQEGGPRGALRRPDDPVVRADAPAAQADRRPRRIRPGAEMPSPIRASSVRPAISAPVGAGVAAAGVAAAGLLPAAASEAEAPAEAPEVAPPAAPAPPLPGTRSGRSPAHPRHRAGRSGRSVAGSPNRASADQAPDLALPVAAQAPRLDLGEGGRIERRPRLRHVAVEAAAEAGPETGHHEREAEAAVMPVDPGVDPRRVPLERLARLR